MSIRIEHRFLNRLLPDELTKEISFLVIGTFNPAPPVLQLLTIQENKEFTEVEKMKSYLRLSEVKNFYDRPQNRFWKIMDLIHHVDFYTTNPLKAKNPAGLKYYRGMDRDIVLARQKDICRSKEIFITDLVRAIEPLSFKDIYYGFPDKGIERAKCEWNTEGIIETIARYRPKKVLINLKSDMKSIPKISKQIEYLKEWYPDKVFHVASTSGNAGLSYSVLYENWKQHFI